MPIVVIGGTGFIGRRLIPLLVQRGESVVCMDINPGNADYSAHGDKVKVVRGDVTQFDQVIGLIAEVKPERLVNLSYYIGSDLPPHVATRLDIVGMDNCFEAARLCGVKHTVYASSVAALGQQSHFGETLVNEDAFRYGDNQYAVNKIFNEWQAKDYRDKYGMVITGIRPANVTGPDKVSGSVDHVHIITGPARGKKVTLPFKDAMRCPIHVDDMAEAFARVLMADKPKYEIYNSGGQTVSLGEVADIVRGFLPKAEIVFEKDTGGREISGNFLIDNSRLITEFGLQYAPYRQRVLQIINDVRKDEGLPPIEDR